MNQHVGRAAHFGLAKGVLVFACLGVIALSTRAQDPKPLSKDKIDCIADLTLAGVMRDILSNALIRSLGFPEEHVRVFLDQEKPKHSNGKDLLKATAANFKLTEAILTAEVETFKHCNCPHKRSANASSGSDQDPEVIVEITQFAKDVTVHVVLHELGHALIREFDLPVLGNEETMADAFATFYLTTYSPDRAFDVIKARTTSLMIEAGDVPRSDWKVGGEHNNDARRAHQIVAIAIAANSAKYSPLARELGMSDSDIKSSKDYGSEIHRSWRRILRPLQMPPGLESAEARVKCDSEGGTVSQLRSGPLLDELEAIVRSFDWHSRVTLHFKNGNGGAGWSRSKRTITVHGRYIYRFIGQGKRAGLS